MRLSEVDTQDAHPVNQNRHLRSGQRQQLRFIHQQVQGPDVVFGSVGGALLDLKKLVTRKKQTDQELFQVVKKRQGTLPEET